MGIGEFLLWVLVICFINKLFNRIMPLIEWKIKQKTAYEKAMSDIDDFIHEEDIKELSDTNEFDFNESEIRKMMGD